MRTTFKASNGTEASGEIFEPSGTGKAPALVLIQEWWGLNDHIRDLGQRFAKEGFLVLAPDLYHGKITKDANEAGKMMTELDRDQAGSEVAGAVKALAEHARSTGKVGVTGFCMGGAYTFAAAAMVPGVKVAVPFYGIPDTSKVDLGKIEIPVQAHVSKTDQWVKPEMVAEVKKKLDAKGVPMEMYVYDAEHAFMNDTRPEVYNAGCAKEAWGRAVGFLKKHLA
jgi:carboxymethylenebutenolidase